MRDCLKKFGFDEELDLIHQVIEYAGKQKRQSDLFGQANGVLGVVGKRLVSTLFNTDAEQNVFLQHKCYVGTLIDLLAKNKQTPYVTLRQSNQPLQQTIVFIVGGATYEEARELS
jgi:hypothetical protein